MNTNDISYLHSEAFNNGHLKDDYKAIISFYTFACFGFDYLKIYGFEENNIMIEEYPRIHSALISDEEKRKIIFNNDKLSKYQFKKTTSITRAIDTLERILRYQKNIYEESDCTSERYIDIILYQHKKVIYKKTYRSFSEYYRDEENNLIQHKTLLPFNSLEKKCLEKHLNNAFHEDKRLKYENKQRYIVDRFIQSLPVQTQHKEKFGLALYTSIKEKLFYVYKNENDTVFIKPTEGKTQFSVPRKRIEEGYIAFHGDEEAYIAFHGDEGLKYENKQRYLLEKLFQSLPVQTQHKKKFGLALYTFIKEKLFYVYKNENDTVFIKPTEGKTQFSVPRKRIEEVYISKETKQSNDKPYIFPICEFINNYIGENIDFIDMPYPNPFRTSPVEYKINNNYKF